MPNTKIVRVPHLWGIDAAYQMPKPYDPSKPTMVLVNSFATSSELYRPQFTDNKILDTMNLLAIEPLGHGQTEMLTTGSFTWWDTAIMNLQVMDALGIQKAFALGTSQGGPIVVRMALLRPERIEGLMPLGASMDHESARSRELGCWDGIKAGEAIMRSMERQRPNLDAQTNVIMKLGFGPKYDKAMHDFWAKEVAANYGNPLDKGKQKFRMMAINMRDRDGLHGRLADIRCPVLWMHGTQDPVFSVRMAQEEIQLFKGAKADLVLVEGGQHFLSASHPDEVGKAMVDFVTKWRPSSERAKL